MVSSLFCRRPRIQPLPPVCKSAPETTSCYEPPEEPPEPLKLDGSATVWTLAGDQIYYCTFSGFAFRYEDYSWTITGYTNLGEWFEWNFEWERGPETALVEGDAPTIPPAEDHFEWDLDPVTDDWPWLISLTQTLTDLYVHKVDLIFYN